MTHWETARRWLMSLFFGGMAFLLVGCPGGPGSDECGGVDARVSCIRITRIQPADITGTSTRDVDTVQSICPDGTDELFGEHNVSITFVNTKFPTADEGLPATIRSFNVSYDIISCPTGATCPPLTGFSDTLNLFVPDGGTVAETFPFVPISVKDEFLNQGGSANAFPIYSASFTFTAVTDFFEDTFDIQTSTSFVMGNFDLCP